MKPAGARPGVPWREADAVSALVAIPDPDDPVISSLLLCIECFGAYATAYGLTDGFVALCLSRFELINAISALTLPGGLAIGLAMIMVSASGPAS